MKKFYLHDGNKQEGPFDIEDLRNKGITRKTKIWYEGNPDWIEAETCAELKDLFKTITPPPFTRSVETKTSNKSSKTRNVIIFSIIGIIVLIFIVPFLMQSLDSSYDKKVMTIEELEIAHPTNFLSVKGEYSENFWGDKINLNCTVINKATVASYKDLLVRVTYYTKTKTSLGTKDLTVYEVFGPNSQKDISLKIDNYQNVNSIDLDVIKALPYK